MLKTKHLAAINGPWQLMLFISFYKVERDNYANTKCDLLYYDMPESLIEQCHQIANCFNFFNNSYTIDKLEELPLDFNVIWIGKLFSWNPKLILEKYTTAEIYLFEEGLHSYVIQKEYNLSTVIRSSISIRNLLGNLKRYYFNDYSNHILNTYSNLVFRHHKSRVKKEFYMLKKSSNRFKNSLLEAIETVYTKTYNKAHYNNYNDRTAFVLGQNFHQYKLLNFDQEYSVYNNIITKLLDKGYSVNWKSHPRSKNFEESIKKEFNDKVTILEQYTLPIELLLFNNPNVILVGISSSSLVYAKEIMKIGTFQAAHEVLKILNSKSIWFRDQNQVLKLTKNKLTSYTQIT